MEAIMRLVQAVITLMLAGAGAVLSNPAQAFDLNGAWTSNATACADIFEARGGQAFAVKGGAGMYGDAFIVQDDKILASAGTCTIKVRKRVGPVTHLIAVCAPGSVALSTFQFSYKVEDENTIVRVFPGVGALDTTYRRCIF